jgi:hypothetical protein
MLQNQSVTIGHLCPVRALLIDLAECFCGRRSKNHSGTIASENITASIHHRLLTFSLGNIFSNLSSVLL